MNEADTCRTYVLPKLKSAGWEDEFITEQLVLTPGRIAVEGQRAAGVTVPFVTEDATQSASGEELRSLFGRTLMPSVLQPQGGAFKGEL